MSAKKKTEKQRFKIVAAKNGNVPTNEFFYDANSKEHAIFQHLESQPQYDFLVDIIKYELVVTTKN